VPEVTTWRSKDGGPIYDEAGLDAIEAIMRDEYKGVPHWGKNENETFTRAQNFNEKYGTDWQTFWDIQKQIDPDRVFISPFISNFWN
jgi:FAD/FMN-containing dehydrogenase